MGCPRSGASMPCSLIRSPRPWCITVMLWSLELPTTLPLKSSAVLSGGDQKQREIKIVNTQRLIVCIALHHRRQVFVGRTIGGSAAGAFLPVPLEPRVRQHRDPASKAGEQDVAD